MKKPFLFYKERLLWNFYIMFFFAYKYTTFFRIIIQMMCQFNNFFGKLSTFDYFFLKNFFCGL